MIPISITVDATPAQLLFAKMAGRLDDQSKVFGGRIYRRTLDFFYEQFFSEGSAGGVHWAALADSTLKQKHRLGVAHLPILQRTQELLKSFTSARHANNIKVVTPHSVIVGSADQVAGFHQLGTSKMPRRPIVPDQMPPSYIDDVREIMEDFIVSGVGA